MACKKQNIECLWVISIINANCKLSILKFFLYILLFALFTCLYNFANNATLDFKYSVSLRSSLTVKPYFHNFYSFNTNSGRNNTTISNASQTQVTGIRDTPQNLEKYYQDNLGVRLKSSNNLHIFSNMFSERHFNFGNLSHGETSSMVTGNQREITLNTTQLGRITLDYEQFNRSLPHFISERDKNLFFLSQDNIKELSVVPQERMTGDIGVLYMANVNQGLKCGWRNNLMYYHHTRASSQKQTRYHMMTAKPSDIIVPLTVPDGWSFQHFIDGVLPKLAQIAPFLSNVNIKIMLKWPRDKIIFEMLQHMGINDSQMINYTNRVTLAGYQLNTCITPPLHPRLWSKMRELIGVGKHLQVSIKEASVILLTRAKSHNVGRNIVNVQEVISYLLSRYNNTFVLFKGGYNLAQSKAIFSKARLVLGVHGGAFYNINFSPVETVVAEYLPIDKSTHKPALRGVALRMVWAMADMNGQRYYRLTERPVLGTNLQLSLTKLKALLDEVDSFQLGKH